MPTDPSPSDPVRAGDPIDGAVAAAADLAAQLLDDLDDGVLPMAHVDSIISRLSLAHIAESRQLLALQVIGSLLSDETIFVGDLVDGDPAHVEPWPGTPQHILRRIRGLYVEHHDHPAAWALRIGISPNDRERGRRTTD